MLTENATVELTVHEIKGRTRTSTGWNFLIYDPRAYFPQVAFEI